VSGSDFWGDRIYWGGEKEEFRQGQTELHGQAVQVFDGKGSFSSGDPVDVGFAKVHQVTDFFVRHFPVMKVFDDICGRGSFGFSRHIFVSHAGPPTGPGCSVERNIAIHPTCDLPNCQVGCFVWKSDL